MKFLNKIIIICFVVFFNFSQTYADEWKDIVFFKRMDIKMKITKHNPPIAVEWGKLEENRISDKLKAIVVATYYNNADDMNYNEWKTYCTLDYINDVEMTKEEFEKTSKTNVEDYPNFRFLNFLYEVDYLIRGKTYSLLASIIAHRN